MLKKIFSVLLTTALLGNITVFAQLQKVEGVYTEDFESYASAGDITNDGTLIKDFTASAPELAQIGSGNVMAVNSASNGTNIVFLNTELFENENNVFKCKMGGEASPRLNWKSAPGLVFSHTNEAGNMVNDYIFDFAYGYVRHRKNGTNEEALYNFTSRNLYDVEIKACKVNTDGNYYFKVDYRVDAKEHTISFPTTENGKMRIGFQSSLGNKVYVDDISVTAPFTAQVAVDGSENVPVNSTVDVVFSCDEDESTLLPQNIFAGGIAAEDITKTDDNSYTITFSEYFEKNTEYTLDLSAVRDMKGNSLRNDEFSFKTRNTALVVDNGSVLNTAGTENLTVIYPQYDANGAMVNTTVEDYTLGAGESVVLTNSEYIVLTEDLRLVDATVLVAGAGLTDDVFSGEINDDVTKITISGKTSASDESVAITIKRQNGTFEYAGVTETDENGYFSIEYTSSFDSRIYTVCAKTWKEEFSSDMRIPLVADINRLLESANSGDKAVVSEALVTYDELLAIEFDLYNSDTDMDYISGQIAKTGGYTTLQQLKEHIKALSVIDVLSRTEDKLSVFEEYESAVLSSSDSEYAMWNGLGNSDKEIILDEVTQEDEFKKNLYLKSALFAVLYSSDYTEVKHITETHYALLGLDLADYEEAGKPDSVAKAMMGKKWSEELFKAKFDELVYMALNPEPVLGYTQDFEAIDDIIGDKTVFKSYTNIAPSIAESGTSKVMTVSSGAGSDNNVYTNTDMFVKEFNVIKLSIGAESVPNQNWKAGSGIFLSHTNESGNMVDDMLVDFGWGRVRHKPEGSDREVELCTFTSKHMYEVEINTALVQRDGKYYYDITYIVDGIKNTVSYRTSDENQKICLGFRSTVANNLYADNLEVYGFDFINADVNINDRNDVSVFPKIEMVFTEAMDDSTVIPENIFADGITAQVIEPADGNRYFVTLSQPLEKNHEYVLDISGLHGTNGAGLYNGRISFKTRNSAIILSDGKLINTDSIDAETILIFNPVYNQNGAMTDKAVQTVEIVPGGEEALTNSDFLVLTADSEPLEATVWINGAGKKDDEFKTEFDTEAQKLTVSGKMASANEAVAVTVRDKNEAVDFAGVTKTDENGYFSIEYIPSCNGGTYTVSAKTVNESFSDTVLIRPRADIEAILRAANTGDVSVIATALERYDEILAIDFDLYTDLADKSFICSEIANNGSYTKIDDLVHHIRTFALIKTIKDIDNKMSVFAGREGVILTADDSAYEIWNGLSEADKESVIDTVIAKGNFNPEAFEENIYRESIFAMIYSANKYIDVKNAIENNSEILGISLTEYDRIGKPASVAKGLVGNKYTYETFAENFNRLVLAAASPVINNTSGGGGGGGGSKGSAVGGGTMPMPQETPEPMEVPEKKGMFTDMGEEHWAYNAVKSLTERKILNGYEDGSFRPDDFITREQFVAVIVRFLGLSGGTACEFADVSESDWYFSDVSTAFANGIIKGVSDNKFGTGNMITRQDAAVVLYNTGRAGKADGEVSFTDSDLIADYASAAVKVLAVSGIISGNPDGSFNPSGELTRAQAAKLIYEFDKEGSR